MEIDSDSSGGGEGAKAWRKENEGRIWKALEVKVVAGGGGGGSIPGQYPRAVGLPADHKELVVRG